MINRQIPQWELNLIWPHTETLRKLRVARMRSTKHSFEYDYSSKEFTWRKEEMAGEVEKLASWSLEGELLRVSKTEKGRVKIEERDILLVCLWVANRAAMWIGSLDSKPLLDFVEELDPHVYVL